MTPALSAIDPAVLVMPTPKQTTTTESQGTLQGRSVVPRPAKFWLTNAQVRKVCLVAMAVITCVIGPVLAGVFSVGLGAILYGIGAGIMGLGYGAAFAYGMWPKVDPQTAKGAEQIREDLEKLSLDNLHDKYKFSDLAYYGFISKENAEEMQKYYERMPEYYVVHDERNSYDSIASRVMNKYHNIEERRAVVKAEFNGFRNKPGFIL